MRNGDTFSRSSSQSSLESAGSMASTEAPLSLQEEKINSLGLIGLISRYIYLGSDDYQQKEEDLRNIKTILSQNVDLLNRESSIEFITTKLCDHFKAFCKFDADGVKSNLTILFQFSELSEKDSIEQRLTNISGYARFGEPNGTPDFINIPTQSLPKNILPPVVAEKDVVIEDESASPNPQCCCLSWGGLYNFFSLCKC